MRDVSITVPNGPPSVVYFELIFFLAVEQTGRAACPVALRLLNRPPESLPQTAHSEASRIIIIMIIIRKTLPLPVWGSGVLSTFFFVFYLLAFGLFGPLLVYKTESASGVFLCPI